MMCPECGYEKTTVQKTAGATKEYAVDRYRKCKNCNNGFKTVEKVETLPTHDDLKAIIFEAVTVAVKEMLTEQNTTSTAPQPIFLRQMPSMAMSS
jgi:hypothetical protein